MSKQNWDAIDTKSIVRSIEQVFKTGNSEKLTKKAYDFLYLAPGFIAHYSIHGFRDHYRNVADLAAAIIRNDFLNEASRQRNDRWFANEYGSAYCNSKADTYEQVHALAEKYSGQLAEATYENSVDSLKALRSDIDNALTGEPVDAVRLAKQAGLI